MIRPASSATAHAGTARFDAASPAARDVLVLGGTGFVGRSVCEALARRPEGGRIWVPTRRLAHGAHLQSLPTVQLVQADVHNSATLARLLAGCDAVVNLVAILHGNETAFEQVHVALPKKLAQACLASGVRRVLHVGALGSDVNAPSMYLRSKARGEAVLLQPSQPVHHATPGAGAGVGVGAQAAASSATALQTTVLRPSVIFGAEDSFLRLFAQLQAVAPVLPLAGSGARMQPVWVQDVAQAVVQCLQQPATAGQVFECVGPQVYTLSELVQLAGRWSGHERPQIALPDWMGWLQAAALELLPGTPLMSRDNIDSMRVPNVASGKRPGLQALGISAASLEAVAPLYLGAHAGRGRFNQWRGMTGRR